MAAKAPMTRANWAPGSLIVRAILVAGAWMRPTILARSSSSDGKAASAFTPLASRTVVPIAPPTISRRSLVLAKSTAALAAATGSAEVAKAVGPVSRSLSVA